MAKNEFGVQLDRNGYAPSIISNKLVCHRCERTNGKLDRHEVFHGPYREKSKNLGCWIYLCHECHMDLHNTDSEYDYRLKAEAEEYALDYYGWSVAEFRRRFGKNYIF